MRGENQLWTCKNKKLIARLKEGDNLEFASNQEIGIGWLFSEVKRLPDAKLCSVQELS